MSSLRAGNPNMRRLGAWSFRFFVFAQLFSLTRAYFLRTSNIDQLANVATVSGIGSLVLLLFAVFGYGNYVGSLWGALRPTARTWLALLWTWTTALLIYGWLVQGYVINAVLQDYGPVLVLIVSTVLGSLLEFWDDLLPTFLGASVIAMLVITAGFQNYADLLRQAGLTARVFGDLLAYDTRVAIYLWPILLLTVRYWRSRRAAFTAYVVSIFALAMQIAFQKRLETATALAYFFTFLFVLPSFATRWETAVEQSAVRRARGRFLLLALVVVIGAVVILPDVVANQTAALLNRYTEEDTSRIDEAVGMLNYLTPAEWLFGRGMGGYFQYTDDRIGAWGEYLEDVRVVGRRQVHAGVLWPMFKGGLILVVIYYAGIALALRVAKKRAKDLFLVSAVTIIIVITAQSLQGVMFAMTGVYNTIILGMSLGYCLRH